MINLFVTDLDGTLLNPHKEIDERDRSSMETLEKLGVQRCLASGRLRGQMIKVAEELGGSFHLVCQNGAHVETADGRVLAQHFFTADLAASIYPIVSARNALTVVCLPDVDIIAGHTEHSLAVERRLLSRYRVMPDLNERVGQDLLPTKFSMFGDRSVLVDLEKDLLTMFPDRIMTYLSDTQCLDVMPNNVSKGAGLRLLMEELRLTTNEVACIGDSFNDVSMFALTKHSFAMKHSLAEVQKQASHVAECVADAVTRVL